MLSIESSYEELFQNVLCGIVQIEVPLRGHIKIHKMNPKAKLFLNSFSQCMEEDEIVLSGYMNEENQKYAKGIFRHLKSYGDRQAFLLQLYNGVIEGFVEYIEATDGVPVIQIFFQELNEEIAIRRREAIQRELLESVLQSVHCGVVRYGYSDGEENIIMTNCAGWTLLGFESEKQCISKGMNGFLPRIHPEDRRNFLRNYYTLSLKNEKNQCEFRIQRTNGWDWLCADLQYLRDTNGQNIVQMTITDITARKQLTERQKAESSEIIHSLGTMYRTILYIDVRQDQYRLIKGETEHAPIALCGCYSKDLDAFCKKVCVRDWKVLCERLGLEYFRNYFQTEGAFLEHEFQAETANGMQAYYRMEAVLSGDADGLAHVTMGMRDVTRQRQQEMQERAALESAYHAETQANQAKTEFLSRMSHDIRTPMNTIVGLLQLMHTDLENPKKIAAYLEMLDTASNLLLDLINDVLDMSRIESGQIKLSVQTFRMDELIKQIQLLIQPQMQVHGHHYQTSISLKQQEYAGDALHLQQILMNLLSNAVKFTPDGGEIELRVWEDVQTSEMHFEVSDNGIGISKAFQKRIFQPFEREEGAEHIQGSGLGMAIVGSLVHLMNGWIEIQSTPGQGSCFQVILPMRPITENAADKKETMDDIKTLDLTGKRILVVEDNAVNRMIACKLLENMGAGTEEAADGIQALDIFAGHAPGWYDLILMDVRMPNMGGYEAVGRLRALPRPDAATIPVIAMTANAFAEDVHAALKAGMNGHLAKPIKMSEFTAMLNKWIPGLRKR